MELQNMTALSLAGYIRQKKVSTEETVKAVFDRIYKKEKEISAYLDLYEEEAYKRAEEVQKGIDSARFHPNKQQINGKTLYNSLTEIK